MGRLGIECGPPRAPLRALSPDDAARLEARLEEEGLLEMMRGKEF